MKNKQNKNGNKHIDDATDEELDQKLARMKQLPRGAFQVAPGVTNDPRNTKVRVTIYLDADILDYFKERATQPNAAAYQTQINQELRTIMERDTTARDVASMGDYTQLLQNKKFIAALAEKVHEYATNCEE